MRFAKSRGLRIDIYNNVYSKRELVEMANSDILKLEKEYSDILEKIDKINDFIYEFKHDQNKEDQVKDARKKRATLRNSLYTVRRRIDRIKSNILNYNAQ